MALSALKRPSKYVVYKIEINENTEDVTCWEYAKKQHSK